MIITLKLMMACVGIAICVISKFWLDCNLSYTLKLMLYINNFNAHNVTIYLIIVVSLLQ